jgi:hypothetical protein
MANSSGPAVIVASENQMSVRQPFGTSPTQVIQHIGVNRPNYADFRFRTTAFRLGLKRAWEFFRMKTSIVAKPNPIKTTAIEDNIPGLVEKRASKRKGCAFCRNTSCIRHNAEPLLGRFPCSHSVRLLHTTSRGINQEP